MPIIRSAAKRMRSDRKRHLRNLETKSTLKTLLRRFEGLLKKETVEKARGLFQDVMKKLDQAVTKRILPKNTASRKKSRLARRLSQLS